MSPNQVIPVENGALSPIAERVLKVPTLTYEYGQDGIVIAVKAELVVRGSLFDAEPAFRQALGQIADRVGSLTEIQGDPTEVVRPPDPPPSRDAAQRERQADPDYVPDGNGPLSQLEIWRLRDRAATRSTRHDGCARSWTTSASRRRAAMKLSCRRSRPTMWRSCLPRPVAARPRRRNRPLSHVRRS